MMAVTANEDDEIKSTTTMEQNSTTLRQLITDHLLHCDSTKITVK